MTCEAKTMARKMIVPTTKMMTMMKTTQSTPGTIEQSSVMYSLKSDGGHCTWCDHIHTTFLGVTLQLIGKQSNVGETILGENHTFEGKSTKQKKSQKIGLANTPGGPGHTALQSVQEQASWPLTPWLQGVMSVL